MSNNNDQIRSVVPIALHHLLPATLLEKVMHLPHAMDARSTVLSIARLPGSLLRTSDLATKIMTSFVQPRSEKLPTDLL